MKRITKNLRALTAEMLAVVMFAGFALQQASAADHKIVVIADPHVMAPELLTNPSNADWTNYLSVSKKLIDYSRELFAQAMADIKAMKPELVLMVGDLTKDGEQASHEYFKQQLDDLGIPTLVIPGNHDLGTNDAKVYGNTTTPAPTMSTVEDFATLYADYGYGATSDHLYNTLTYACEPIDGLVVIGIDSGTNGTLSFATLSWVCAKAREARSAGKQVIAMMHHPLIPHITGGDTFTNSVSVTDYAEVRNQLADAGISVVFTGHFHTSDIAKDWNADLTKTIYDVTTGSLCSYPCDYRVVTLNEAMTSMSIATSTVTGPNTLSEDEAKDRLSESMTIFLTPKIKAKLVANGQNEMMASILASMLTPSLVGAYIYHAEGNENENDNAQNLLTSLNALLKDYPSYYSMANSMLQDKSNFGDEDREDQTNDRTLTLTLEKTVPGDANNDGFVDAADLVEMINAKNGRASERFNLTNADINRDGEITQEDIEAVVNLIMENY